MQGCLSIETWAESRGKPDPQRASSGSGAHRKIKTLKNDFMMRERERKPQLPFLLHLPSFSRAKFLQSLLFTNFHIRSYTRARSIFIAGRKPEYALYSKRKCSFYLKRTTLGGQHAHPSSRADSLNSLRRLAMLCRKPHHASASCTVYG